MMTQSFRALAGRQLRRLRRRLVRLNRDAILETLRSLGAFSAPNLMVHSSLSACGHIEGGPTTVIYALQEWIGDRNLVLPTHTYCYPDAHGDAPVYDSRLTSSVVGAITNEYWRQPGTARSIHPTHSLAASGPDAAAICADHQLCETPCGKATPYERLVHQDSAALMFGVTMNSYTFFHTAEDAGGLPFLYEQQPYLLQYRDSEGYIRTLKMWRHDMGIRRRFAVTRDWLENRGLLITRSLGLGELLYLPHVADVHAALLQELKENPLFLVDEVARSPLLEKYALTHEGNI
jgi:aminoglycoside 3-N-acetyltransferase